MSRGIAIVGIGCRYPDARSPKEFWENILSQRRAFRRIPRERLPLAAYYSADRSEPDKTYSPAAALIDGFEFDRVRYRIAGSTFRATDIAQWLALDVASDALADAGYSTEGPSLPRDTTGVVLGNTLTGEVSRANTLRLRWPYMERTLRSALRDSGLPAGKQDEIVHDAERRYKASFPPVNHESLAGGLSNTIPGRICNHFDFHGGGYTVDGACAASLLAVTTACAALESRDMDLALAGGVDISLDPFELVGFAKMGALAEHDMLVYDEHSAGFLPGEGCGIVVLKRLDDAVAHGNRIYAVIRGWGVSSDGQGGLTTPAVSGQALALRRAYARAGYEPGSVAFIEGHGTGTTVGDRVELAAMAHVIGESLLWGAEGAVRPAVGVGSVKANIGHTKAAAGIAGLIKTALALDSGILPPMPGCVSPNALFRNEARRLFPLRRPRVFAAGTQRRAGVSAFGFGGINTHIALEAHGAAPKTGFTEEERRLASSRQDCEVFFFSARRPEELKALLDPVHELSLHLSQAETADLAAFLASRTAAREVRAAVVASTPAELHAKLGRLAAILGSGGLAGQFSHIDVREGVFLTKGMNPPRVGFLYPGQGVQRLNMALPWFERHDYVRSAFAVADAAVSAPPGEDVSGRVFRDADCATDEELETWKLQLMQTEVAQPAIVAASVAVTMVLTRLGIVPSLAIGYSLGEWSALWSAGALSMEALFRCVSARGKAMAARGDVAGGMATVAAPAEAVGRILEKVNGYAVIAGYNGPKQVVISGESAAVQEAAAICRREGYAAIPLKVSNAFHSRLVAPAAETLNRELLDVVFSPTEFPVVSTVSAEEVRPRLARELLVRQILEPIRFMDAVSRAEGFGVDVFVEVGPGRSLSAMLADAGISGVRSILSTDDEGGTSFRQMNMTIACLFALGVRMHTERLFEERFTRPFRLDDRPRFIPNPCEADSGTVEEPALPRTLPADAVLPAPPSGGGPVPAAEPVRAADMDSFLEVVLDLAAEITEYPRADIRPEHMLLRDLNLNSIASAQLAAEAARKLGLPRPADVTEYSAASLRMIASALFDLAGTQGSERTETARRQPEGLAPWTRPFMVAMEEQAISPPRLLNLKAGDRCLVIGEEGHPVVEALLERLAGQGVAAEPVDALAPEEHLESLIGSMQHCDAAIFALPLSATAASWDEDPVSFSARIERATRPLFAAGPLVARLLARQRRRDIFLGLMQFGGGMFGRGGVLSPAGDLATGSGFTKSLALELNLHNACVVDLAPDCRPHVAAAYALTEFQNASGFVEAGITADGCRRVPLLRLPEEAEAGDLFLTPEDVLLVTGGGRGIAASCALAAAASSGCRVALLGRTQRAPEGSRDRTAALEETLARFDAAGITYRYVACDVADAESVARAVTAVSRFLGTVTAVLHAAGNNVPQAAANITQHALGHILKPKIHGTMNLLRALDMSKVRLFGAFGSVIAQTGMRGESAYAFANEWMNAAMLRLQEKHPGTRFFCANWSVWSGMGMGHQLGSVDALAREGIVPITPESGVAEFLSLLRRPLPSPEVVIAGRLGDAPTLSFASRPIPLRRFLERVPVHYPGVEIIAECDLSTENDLYLRDHVLHGMQLFPAVAGLEAMVQVASALVHEKPCTSIDNAEFLRPIMNDERGTTTIRIAAQKRREAGTEERVEVAIRSAETKFGMDHFRCVCVFGAAASEPALPVPAAEEPLIPLSPGKDLYGGMLFQGPMFQQLSGYIELAASSCLAVIDAGKQSSLFGRYQPQFIATGAPAVRDVFLHAIQPCVPQRTILPLSIRSIRFCRPPDGCGRLFLRAVEREHSNDEYEYDLKAFSAEGEVVEVLEGFRCRALGSVRGEHPAGREEAVQLPEGLAASYLERSIQEHVPGARCSLFFDFARPAPPAGEGATDRRDASRRALSGAVRNLLRQVTGLDSPAGAIRFAYRADGRPEAELEDGLKPPGLPICVSASHINGLTMGAAGLGTCGCDIEAVRERNDRTWEDLLGREGMERASLMAAESGEPECVSRTRIWTIMEALKKAGMQAPASPLLFRAAAGGCTLSEVRTEGNCCTAVTHHLRLGPGHDVVVAVLLARHTESYPASGTPNN